MAYTLSEFICTDLITIEADADIGTLESRLDRTIDYGVPVLGSNGRIRGVITPTDLLRVNLQSGSNAQSLPVHSVCRRIRTLLPESARLRRARRLFLTRDLDSLMILDEKKHLAGIIFRRDLEGCGLLPARKANWRRPTTRPSRGRQFDSRTLFSNLSA